MSWAPDPINTDSSIPFLQNKGLGKTYISGSSNYIQNRKRKCLIKTKQQIKLTIFDTRQDNKRSRDISQLKYPKKDKK